MAAGKGGNEITGGITSMPTFLNKIFVGRSDGWVEIWNVSTGKLNYTLFCLLPLAAVPSHASSQAPRCRSWPSHTRVARLVITNVLTDKRVLQIEAGNHRRSRKLHILPDRRCWGWPRRQEAWRHGHGDCGDW